MLIMVNKKMCNIMSYFDTYYVLYVVFIRNLNGTYSIFYEIVYVIPYVDIIFV